ncbi:hypothetical protein V6N13_004799 [Hibiscus sabdariffa]
MGLEVVVVNIYIPCNVLGQVLLWNDLGSQKGIDNLNRFLGGDFYATRCRRERSDRAGLYSGSNEFNDSMFGKKFTWLGQQNKKSKLDRFLLDEQWYVNLKDMVQSELKSTTSDLVPVLLVIESFNWSPRPFKFINGWLQKKGCREFFKKVLVNEEGPNGGLISKLREHKK